MQRNLSALTANEFDLIVVGAGIYGACVAWEAAQRGLSVALLEKEDFCSATSANSLKTIHGGFRYLQNLDFLRMRESIQERRALSRIAPHLIHPLPVLIPTYGHGMKGREILAAGLLMNDLIGFDRNRLEDPQKKIPNGKVISKAECLQLLPGLPDSGLTGGAIFYDAQVYNSERLALVFIRSAQEAGAQVANYAQVTGILHSKGAVRGVQVTDLLGGERFEVQSKMVVNTAGPWIDDVAALLEESRPLRKIGLSKAINLVTRQLFRVYAVGLPGNRSYQDSGTVAKKESFLFISPWRGRSMIGTTYAVYDQAPDSFKISEADIQNLLDQINQAYPEARLRWEDVSYVQGGMLPMEGIAKGGSVRLHKHYQIIDHARQGAAGMISVVGVKYTTARDVAQKVIDQVLRDLGRPPVPSRTAELRLQGGQIDRFDDFLQTEIEKHPCGLGVDEVRSLVYNYGSDVPAVLRYFDVQVGGDQTLTREEALLRAQTLFAVRHEMAVRLADVVFRRTELGTAGHPGETQLRFCAQVMADEFGWTAERLRQELEAVNQAYLYEN